jgi:hypothetical protein
MDRLESMSILLTAVEAGSFSAAARRLDTSLATVSRKVSELESHEAFRGTAVEGADLGARAVVLVPQFRLGHYASRRIFSLTKT